MSKQVMVYFQIGIEIEDGEDLSESEMVDRARDVVGQSAQDYTIFNAGEFEYTIELEGD